MTVAQKLKNARAFRNMTQQELSDQTGISVRLIQKYEAGDRSPKVENLSRIAEALKVCVESLSPPDLSSYQGVIFALFEIEETHGKISLQIQNDGKVALTFDGLMINAALQSWDHQRAMLTKPDLKEWQLGFPVLGEQNLLAALPWYHPGEK